MTSRPFEKSASDIAKPSTVMMSVLSFEDFAVTTGVSSSAVPMVEFSFKDAYGIASESPKVSKAALASWYISSVVTNCIAAFRASALQAEPVLAAYWLKREG